MAAKVHRRISYILPAPTDPPPLLALPPLGQRRRGVTHPQLDPLPSNGGAGTSNGRNPFASPQDEEPPHTNGASFDASTNGFGAYGHSHEPDHPRHCLGITSLALDTTTVLADSSSPGGILYTGGRDGLVASWDLGIPHKKRRGARYDALSGRVGRVKWERIGDSAEMWFDDEESEDDVGPEDDVSSEDWAGEDGYGVGGGRRRPGRGEGRFEDQWQVDREALGSTEVPGAAYRQSAQTHTDWVNAMLLCNYNQTVVTASSDRTIQAWSPHSSTDSSPALVGRHRDYVRALQWAPHPSLLFSGSLDHTIAIWDVTANTPDTPLLSIDVNKADDFLGVGHDDQRGSVYSLGVDPAGSILAAGTPERIVRLWDPRAGDKSIARLVGHSDCVRSILVSDDGRYMLTGSSDRTIKLWSLAAHQCLHTFNHHTSSVWALHSDHPNLERFYSGSRDGVLCAVDVEGVTDLSDGECVVLAQEGHDAGKDRKYRPETKIGNEGIRAIVGMDDEFVWTSTGIAEVKRWRDVGRRVTRLSEGDDDGVSYHGRESAVLDDALSPVLEPADGPSTPQQHHRPGSIRSRESPGGPGGESRDLRSVAFAPPPHPRGESSPGGPPSITAISTTLRERLNLQSKRDSIEVSVAGSVISDDDALAVQDTTMATLNGIPYDSLVSLCPSDSPYTFALGPAHRSGDVDARSVHSLSRGNKSDADHRSPAQRARDEYADREVASEAVALRQKPEDVITGRPGLVRSIVLNDRQHVLTVDAVGEVAVWNIVKGICVGKFVAKDVAAELHLEWGERGVKCAESAVREHSMETLEMIKDRIEGETVVVTWCQVDTRIGSLVVHLEEGRVFDAEVYADQLGLPGSAKAHPDARINLGKWVLANLFRGLITAEEKEVRQNSPTTTVSSLPSMPRSSELRPASLPLERGLSVKSHRVRQRANSSVSTNTALTNISTRATPASRPALIPEDALLLAQSAPSTSGWVNYQSFRPPTSPANTAPISPSDTTGGRDYFSINRRKDPSPTRTDKAPPTPGSVTSPSAAPPTTPGSGGMLGKLKFGKKKKTETPMAPVIESAEIIDEDAEPEIPEREAEQLRMLDLVRSHAFHPPGYAEAPPIEFPGETALLIAEESKDAGAWAVTYRSHVGSTEEDMVPLEMNAPVWLLEYLFTARIPSKSASQVLFILAPAPGSGLKELGKTATEDHSRVNGPRASRTRKLSRYVVDQLQIPIPPHTRMAPSATASGDQTAQVSTSREDIYYEDIVELVYGDMVVDPLMTLGTLRHYYGKGDMLLHYRLKQRTTTA